MDNDTDNLKQEIIARYQKLPSSVKDAVSSLNMSGVIKTIAASHGLLVDKMGILHNEIMLVLLGIEPSSSFVENLGRQLNVSDGEVVSIATEVNEGIFAPIRTYLREWEDAQKNSEPGENIETKEAVGMAQRQETVSSIEQAGDFNIVPETKETANNITAADKPKILSELENPSGTPVVPTPDYREPLVDQLLQGQTILPVKTAAPAPKVSPAPQTSTALPQSPQPQNKPPQKPSVQQNRPKEPDPYRENV